MVAAARLAGWWCAVGDDELTREFDVPTAEFFLSKRKQLDGILAEMRGAMQFYCETNGLQGQDWTLRDDCSGITRSEPRQPAPLNQETP